MPTLSLECDAAMSDAVLQAARGAIAPHLAQFSRWSPDAAWINHLPEKQRPLVPLLMALIDSAESVAKAIGDNAFDDSRPLDKRLAAELDRQARNVADAITGATHAPDASAYSLPSMTGKELV